MKLSIGFKEFEASLEGDDIPEAVVGTFQRLNNFLDATPAPKRKKAASKKSEKSATAETPAAAEATTADDPFAPPPVAETPAVTPATKAASETVTPAPGGTQKTPAEFKKLIVAHHGKVGEEPIRVVLQKYGGAKISDVAPENFNNVLIELGLNDG